MSRVAGAALLCGLVVESAGLYLAPLPVAASDEGGQAASDVVTPEPPPAPLPVTDSPKSIKSQSLPEEVKIVASQASVTLTDATTSRAIDAGEAPIISVALAPTKAESAGDIPAVQVETVPTIATESPDTTAGTEPTAPSDPAAPPDPIAPTGGEKVEPIELDVRVLSTDSALEFGLDWLAFTMTKSNVSKSDTVRVSIDYSSIRYAFGGDWADRLQLVRLANCGIASPKSCEADPEVMTVVSNDVRNNILIVDVPLTRAPKEDGGGIAGHNVTRRSMVEDPDLYGLSSGSGGQNGNWSATSLGRTGQWGVNGATGSFTWSYPIATPAPLAGTVPSLSLGYNSASLDGFTADANNQGSWVGAGWDLSTGFIERSYQGCAGLSHYVGYGGAYDGLQCWYTDPNGVRDQLSISLNGQSSRMVPIGADEWRLEDDPAWRVTRQYGGACLGGDPTDVIAGKGGPRVDNDNEYFVVTTPDGVQYTFGCGREPNTSLYTDSVWAVPVAANLSTEPCYSTNINQSWCYQAYRWNLDRIAAPILTNSDTGATGTAVTTIYYAAEINWFDTNLSYYGEIKPYVRGGYPTVIAYTKISGSESADPPARVQLPSLAAADEPRAPGFRLHLLFEPLEALAQHCCVDAHHRSDVDPFEASIEAKQEQLSVIVRQRLSHLSQGIFGSRLSKRWHHRGRARA